MVGWRWQTERVIRLTRPSDRDIEHVRSQAVAAEPTFPAEGRFRDLDHRAVVGHGSADMEAAREVLRNWQMHTDAGVSAAPVPLAVGETVVMWTRTAGLWLLFACRIVDTVDSDRSFGFTYATLPGHPEQGRESFIVSLEPNGDVALNIRAHSRPALLLSRLSGPIGRVLQRRYTAAYANAVRQRIEAK